MKLSNRVWMAAFAALFTLACGAENDSAAARAGTEMASAASAGTQMASAASSVAGTKVEVYKSATCGCCTKWIEHLEAMGFEVEATDTEEVYLVKEEHGVPRQLESCHTALVDGYVIEGHVPGDVIARLLEERPEVAGLAVPGMPIGSPGMEQGDRVDSYDVIAFDASGATRVYESR